MNQLGAPDFEPRDPTLGGQVTQLLQRAGRGDRAATDELFPLVYDELRRLAGGMLAAERASHTLQPTALVHEAYMRLVGPTDQGWEGRAHFFGAAARAIRRILVDHARARGRAKRGGGWQRVALEEQEAPPSSPLDLLALDDALEHLARIDPRMARLVELRFFAGLAVADAAEALGISAATAAREWELARVWLHARLSEDETRDA
ncbi:MAG TPA: sigma-70 family RNA polymerase sigma factor [Phycisphaerales bacterium]|nr:sigma-70 family RNA polymerase sigma factor [Phycisphaerales bacterium]